MQNARKQFKFWCVKIMAHTSKKSSFYFAEIPISRVGLERNPREVGGITVL